MSSYTNINQNKPTGPLLSSFPKKSTYSKFSNDMNRSNWSPPPKKTPPKVPSSPSSIDESPVISSRSNTNSFSSSSLDDPAKIFENERTGVCSLFKIFVQQGRCAYRYDVDVYQYDKDRKKSLTKGEDDGQKTLNKNICEELMQIAYEKTRNFGVEDMAYVYDYRSTIFTSQEVALGRTTIEISPNDTSRYVKKHTHPHVTSFIITLTPSATSHIIDLCDLSQYTQCRNERNRREDRSIRTFLEMLLSQDVLRNKTYTQVGAGSLFENDEATKIKIGMGMTLRSGISKGVRIIENDGLPTPALVIDFKKSPFYTAQWFIDSIADICDKKQPSTPQDPIWSVVDKYYNGVRLYCSYMPSNHFALKCFTREAIKDIMVECNGKQVSIVKYYQIKYNIKLEYGHFPAVIPMVNGKSSSIRYFPIELLKILPNQRVPLEKMHENMSKIIHRENVVRPDVRYTIIQKSLEKLNLNNTTNELLTKFGVMVEESGNQIRIGVRHKPYILMDGMKLRPNEKTKWNGTHRQKGSLRYTMTTPLRKWAILYPAEMKNATVYKDFTAVLRKFAKEKGIQIDEPKLMQFENGKLSVWHDAFTFLSSNGAQMVMLIDPRENKTHGKLKLFECLYKVLTQHLTHEKMIECVRGRPQTLENIVNKLNCKNFGLNYMPIVEPIAAKYSLERGDVLVVGYDVCHPPPASSRERRLMYLNESTKRLSSLEPSIVGITANVASNPHMFVGDFFYQESRKESVDVLELSDRMTWLLKLLRKNRPQHSKPNYIFVVRDGLSEGQFQMATQEELPALKDGCLSFDPTYDPKFVFIIATKRHNKRFFALVNGRTQNLEPGSVIDGTVTRQDCSEFYMQSHYPIQGTGKATQYGIPVDEIDITQDEVQAMLNMLCYEHQIINGAISIPEPVYQADELAKRGQDVYREFKAIEPEGIPYLEESYQIDFKELNKKLGYKNSILESTRFSA